MFIDFKVTVTKSVLRQQDRLESRFKINFHEKKSNQMSLTLRYWISEQHKEHLLNIIILIKIIRIMVKSEKGELYKIFLMLSL